MSNLIRLLFHGANFMHLKELLKVHLESIFQLIRSILSHYVLARQKKGSAALNRAILGPPLPYPIEVLDERQKKKAAGIEKTL